MKLPSLLRHLVPESTHSQMARDPKRAIAGINELLGSVKNLPFGLRNNDALSADARLRHFARWAAAQPVNKASFKAALKDIREITWDIKGSENIARKKLGAAGSSSSEICYEFLRAGQQGRALKHFRAAKPEKPAAALPAVVAATCSAESDRFMQVIAPEPRAD